MDLGGVTLSAVVNGITSNERGIISRTRIKYVGLLLYKCRYRGKCLVGDWESTRIVTESIHGNKVLINEWSKE